MIVIADYSVSLQADVLRRYPLERGTVAWQRYLRALVLMSLVESFLLDAATTEDVQTSGSKQH